MSQDGKHLFTSESVTVGHPDKVCDQVSDAILDSLLAQDPNSRVACETLATTGMVLIAGEITTEGYSDFQKIVAQSISDNLLRWKGIEATIKIAESTNAKVVIVGSGKDGLPVILDTK